MNKLRAVLLHPYARATLGCQTTDIGLDRVLDGGIRLVRVPKSTLGDDTARLIGSFVLAKTWEAATHSASTPGVGCCTSRRSRSRTPFVNL